MTDSPRIALVTGAARGIGAATVRQLCSLDYRVIAVDSCAGDSRDMRGPAYALATRSDLEAVAAAHPDQVTPVIADVRDPTALIDAAQLAVNQHGRLDAAVAAAAVIIGGQRQWETPLNQFWALLETDVIGVWNTASACIPHMLTNPAPHHARFVAVASAAGQRGLFHLSAYCAAKHAVIGLIRGIAADLVGTGITATAVSPGATRTVMLEATAELYDLEDVEQLVAAQLLRRTLLPDEIAATLAFCCGIDAAALNGSVVSATGGFAG